MLLLRTAFRSLNCPLTLTRPRIRTITSRGPEEKDYYEILGVDPSATEAEIKAAYRRLAKMYHPDINATGDKHEPNADKFREVAEAYAVLSYHESRIKYNNARKRKEAAAGGKLSAGAVPIEVQE